MRDCLSLFGGVLRRLPILPLVVAGLLVSTATIALAPTQSASAITRTSTLSPSDKAKSFAYYKGLRNCFAVGAYKNSIGTVVPPAFVKAWTMSASNAVGFDWFHGWKGVIPVFAAPAGIPDLNVSDLGVVIDAAGDGDGVMNCGDAEGKGWLTAAAALWGYPSGPALLCALDFGRDVNQSNCAEIVPGATNDFHAPGGAASAGTVPGKLDAIWTGALGASGTGIESIGAGEYQLYLQSFKAACRVISPGSGDYTIYELNEETNTLRAVEYGVGDRDRGTGYSVRVHQGLTRTCQQLADVLGDEDGRPVSAYRTWLKENDGSNDQPKTDGQTCDEAGVCTEPTTSCNIPDLGWILCPVLTTGANLADSAYGFLSDNFLETDVSLVNTDPNKTNEAGALIGTGTYTAWKIMQGLANVAFVIVFLIIIFSQLTGVGVSNYGVKKLIPRVIVAAVLVNLSFLVCQLAVDVSNILGYSLKGLFEGVAKQVAASGGGTAASTTDESGNLAGIVTLVIAGGVLVWINVGALFVAVIGALASLLVIFLLLVARKVLIVLLIVVAPLAFVAYLLPNTEPLFQKWRKALTALLLLFPIIGVLYGASLLASAIMLQVAGDDVVLRIAAYLALVIPLFAVIPLLRGSLDGIGKIGGAIQSFGQKARGGAQKSAQKTFDRSRLGQFKKYRSGVIERRGAQIAGGTFQGDNRNPLNWGRNARSAVNRNVVNPASGQFGRDLTGTGADLVEQETERGVKSATSLINEQRLTSGELQELAHGREVRRDGRLIMRAPNEAMRQAAVREKMKSATTGEVEQLLVGSAGASARVRQELARGIHSNGHVAKADYLGGDFADRVIRGQIGSNADIDDAAARRIQTGKLSAGAMVGQDADALARFARVSGDASAGTRTDIGAPALDALRDTAIEAGASDQTRGKITGQKANPIDTMSRL